jgi:hypothetical protein
MAALGVKGMRKGIVRSGVIKELNVELVNSIILSFPDRLKAVIKAKGRHTKY